MPLRCDLQERPKNADLRALERNLSMWQPIALREKTPCQYSLLKGILPSHHYTMYTNRWLRLLAVSVLLLLCCDAAVCWMRNFAKGFAIYGSRFQQGKQGNSLYPLLFMPPSAGSTAGQGGPFYLGNGAFDPGFDYTARLVIWAS